MEARKGGCSWVSNDFPQVFYAFLTHPPTHGWRKFSRMNISKPLPCCSKFIYKFDGLNLSRVVRLFNTTSWLHIFSMRRTTKTEAKLLGVVREKSIIPQDINCKLAVFYKHTVSSIANWAVCWVFSSISDKFGQNWLLKPPSGSLLARGGKNVKKRKCPEIVQGRIMKPCVTPPSVFRVQPVLRK